MLFASLPLRHIHIHVGTTPRSSMKHACGPFTSKSLRTGECDAVNFIVERAAESSCEGREEKNLFVCMRLGETAAGDLQSLFLGARETAGPRQLCVRSADPIPYEQSRPRWYSVCVRASMCRANRYVQQRLLGNHASGEWISLQESPLRTVGVEGESRERVLHIMILLAKAAMLPTEYDSKVSGSQERSDVPLPCLFLCSNVERRSRRGVHRTKGG